MSDLAFLLWYLFVFRDFNVSNNKGLDDTPVAVPGADGPDEGGLVVDSEVGLGSLLAELSGSLNLPTVHPNVLKSLLRSGH